MIMKTMTSMRTSTDTEIATRMPTVLAALEPAIIISKVIIRQIVCVLFFETHNYIGRLVRDLTILS